MEKMMGKMKQQLEEMKKMMEGEGGEGKKKGEKPGKSSKKLFFSFLNYALFNDFIFDTI